MKDLSIIILTYNQKALTMRCLESLRPQYYDDGIEIILVDNGSDDGTEAEVRTNFPKVKYLKRENNTGVAAGRNFGLKHASGSLLMLLDNDTIVPAGAIDGLKHYMDSHPKTGLVAPRLTNTEGMIQKSWKDYPGLGVKIKNVLSKGKNDHYASKFVNKELEPFYVIGASQMFRREVLEKTGFLDENIFYGPEDADFCMRVRLEGWKVVYYPKITIIHDWQRATTRKLFSVAARRHIKSLLYFYSKWGRWF